MDAKKTIAKVTDLIKNTQYDQAITLLKELLSTDTKNELAIGLLASVYAEIQMDDKAIELYQQMLDINPNNPLARFQLGMIYFNKNQYDDAINIWLASVVDDKNFMLHYYTGLAYLQKNQAENAQPMLAKARQYMPENHPLFKNLNDLVSNRQNIH